MEVDCQLSVSVTRPTTDAPASVKVERTAATSSSEAPGSTTNAIWVPVSEPVSDGGREGLEARGFSFGLCA